MKENVQKFGRFLSGMVMPNIGAFILWFSGPGLPGPVGLNEKERPCNEQESGF